MTAYTPIPGGPTVYSAPKPMPSDITPADPLAPETTVYWDQSTGAQEPGAGGPVVAWRVYYDNSLSGLTSETVQGAIDLLDNALDNITGASASLDARVDALEVEMDQAQADIDAAEANIVNLQGRMVAAEADIDNLETTDAVLQGDIDTLETDLAALTARVTTAEGDIDAAEASIVILQGQMITAQADIDTAQADIIALQAADVALDGRLDTAEANITDLQGRMTAAEASIVTLTGKTQPATETNAGIAEIATTAEVTTGTDDARIVTPAKLAARLASLPGAAPATETVAGIAEIATQAEVNTGTDDARIVSALKLAARLAAFGTAYVLKSGDTMTGNLTISKADPQLVLNATSGAPYVNWLQASVQRAVAAWDNANSRLYFNINNAAGAYALTALSLTANGIGIDGVPPNSGYRVYAKGDWSYITMEGPGNTNVGFRAKNSLREWMMLVENGTGNLAWYDGTAAAYRMRIETTGRVHVDQNFHVTGNINTDLSFGAAGDVYAAGQFRGGPGDAARLRCWGTANLVNFRWDNSDLLYRIDEAVERKLMWTSTGAVDFRVLGSQPGPTGYGAFVTQPNASGTAYGWYVDMVSDPSLKLDIAPSTVDALAAINAIDVIRYRWNPDALAAVKQPRWDTSCELGLNAEQLRSIIPEMAGRHAGADGLLRLNLKQGVPWLIKAVQQLSARVAELERRNGH